MTASKHFNTVAIAFKFDVSASTFVNNRDLFHFSLGVITSVITEPERLIIHFKSTCKSGFVCITLLFGAIAVRILVAGV